MKIRMTRLIQAIVTCTATIFLGGMLQVATAQETANLPYMDTKLTPEQRATDLVHRMTLAEKASRDAEQLRGGAAAQYSRIPMVERGAAWRDQPGRNRVSGADRSGRHLRSAGNSYHGEPDRHRGAHQACAECARRTHRHHGRPGFLVPESEHLPRSALGPRTGDLRRRSVPHRPHGGCLRDRNAGRRPEVLPGYCNAEALSPCTADRSQRGTLPMWT